MSAPQRMSLRKFWCRTFGGGIGTQFDWLAISMTGGFNEQAYGGKPVRDGQEKPSLLPYKDTSKAKLEPPR
ncbi:hypothetical protein FF80_03888 [Devosia sp. LC5]|uniref:hypothetical protein n=1 Tax=Devosia sp. LC5 TaxID=1502724 RepID=UPI0004E42B62|nr:hypothetical protein [Devosia sp. LC5]KFC61692.1 hypothetical protein FF80_03888 [Devosia sp. LC5]